MIMPIDIDKKEFSRDKKGYNSSEVDEFLDIIVADYEKILVSAPYNEYYDAEGHGMHRVHSWNEIENVLVKMGVL